MGKLTAWLCERITCKLAHTESFIEWPKQRSRAQPHFAAHQKQKKKIALENKHLSIPTP